MPKNKGKSSPSKKQRARIDLEAERNLSGNKEGRKAIQTESIKPPKIKKKSPKPKKIKKQKEGFYSSWEWKRVRYRALLKYKHQCMCCGMSPPLIYLVVYHIKPRRKYPQLELKISNLQVLCNSCNMGKGSIDETDFRTMPEIEWAKEQDDYWKDNL